MNLPRLPRILQLHSFPPDSPISGGSWIICLLPSKTMAADQQSIAIVGAVIFFVILVDQGNSSPTLDPPPFMGVR